MSITFFPPNYISRIFPCALSIDVNLVSCNPSWLTIRRRFASVIPCAAPLSLPLWDGAGDSTMQMFEAAFKRLIGLLLHVHTHFYWYILFIFTDSINSDSKNVVTGAFLPLTRSTQEVPIFSLCDFSCSLVSIVVF